MNKLIIFGSGLFLGLIGNYMWLYSPFLYYAVFMPQTIIIYFLLTMPIEKKRIKKVKSK